MNHTNFGCSMYVRTYLAQTLQINLQTPPTNQTWHLTSLCSNRATTISLSSNSSANSAQSYIELAISLHSNIIPNLVAFLYHMFGQGGNIL